MAELPGDLPALVNRLLEIYHDGNLDPEDGHVEADKALLDYVGDEKVRGYFDLIPKWYA